MGDRDMARALGGRAAQMRQGVPGDAHHAEDIDVEDALPFLVVVVGDGSDGADTGVGDEGVQRAELRGRPVDRAAYGLVVGHVGLEGEDTAGHSRDLPVEYGDPRPAAEEQPRHGGPDARCTAGHHCGQ